VRYEVAADADFRRIVRRGAAFALPQEAFTVHAEPAGLAPDTHYWYRFKVGTTESRIGRTRTAPAPGSRRTLRFAYVSCQNYTNGFFGAYADLADQDIDLVVHLGDYIYEGPGLGDFRVRDHAPQRELFSLEDYRTRHAQYKTDPQLQDAHAAFPFLMTWDDHEFKDNYADLDLEPDQPLETVEARRAAAYLAYWEHSPLPRARKPVGKDMPLFRRAAWGDLATFHVLDTRQYRSNQIEACLAEHRLRNTVVITGDAHEHAVRNVPPSFRSLDGAPVATEFMGSSATSEGQTPFGTTFGGSARNPHQLFNDHHRGYVLVTLEPGVWSAEFRGLTDVTKADTGASTIARFVVENGKPGGVRDGL
jgi:alkaline phosphatase D